MIYKVHGIGVGNQALVYETPGLSEAGYLASKMADQGVADVRITDRNGFEIALDDAVREFMRNPPLGLRTLR